MIPERAVSGYLHPEDTSPGPRRLGAAGLGKLGSSGPLGRPWVSIWAPLMEPGPSQPLPRHPAIAAPSRARGAVLVPGGGRQWPEGGTECSAPGWRQKPIIAPAKEDQFVPSQPCPLGRVSSCTVSREGPRSLGPLGPWVWASPERGLHLRSRTVLHPLQAALSLALSTDSPCPARGTSCWAVTLESLPECRWQPCCTYASRAGDPGSPSGLEGLASWRGAAGTQTQFPGSPPGSTGVRPRALRSARRGSCRGGPRRSRQGAGVRSEAARPEARRGRTWALVLLAGLVLALRGAAASSRPRGASRGPASSGAGSREEAALEEGVEGGWREAELRGAGLARCVSRAGGPASAKGQGAGPVRRGAGSVRPPSGAVVLESSHGAVARRVLPSRGGH